MGSEHYCLRWNNHQSNLLGVFSQLLESESLVDVTLACTEGPSIRAHKVVLSACSSYFQALFLDHPNRHPIVILKDVRFAELRTLVDFMYKGEVNVEYCQLSALLKTAESLKVKGLADMTNINAAAATAANVKPSSRDEQQQHEHQEQSSQQQQQQTSTTTTTSPTTISNQQASEPMIQDELIETRHRTTDRDCRERDSRNNDRDRSRDRERDREKRDRETTSREKELSAQHQQTSQQQQQHPHHEDENECSADDVEISECPPSPTTRTRGGIVAVPNSPSPGQPLALDRPRSRRDSDSAASLEETRGSVSPLSVHSGPSDMSLSNNNGAAGGGVTPVTIPISSLSQSRLPSPHSTEPLAGPSGLPPVQQVPLSLKKEVDWERSTEERSASSEMSSDYRMPPDPVSLALGLESASWGGLSPGELVGSEAGTALLSSAGFAAGLAGLARRCGVCLASFPSTWLLERHAILQHAGGQPSDDKPFTCEQCGQRYRYRSAYVKHREQNHRARLPADKLFTCDVCGMQFRYLKSFKKHRLNHALERLHRGPSNDSQSLTERSDQVSSTGEPSQLETGSAGDASPLQVDSEERAIGGRDTPSELGGREEAASSETSVQESPCDMTTEVLQESINRRNALSLVRSTILNNDVDDVPMEDDRNEPADPTTTTTISSAITTVATTTTSLNLSINRATGHHETDRRERRFACPFCGKCVRSKENLKLHVRKHTGERPFVCLFCGRAFGGKSDLTRHLRIHTGERPYHCEMCGKCFARADYLSKHLTTHIHQR